MPAPLHLAANLLALFAAAGLALTVWTRPRTDVDMPQPRTLSQTLVAFGGLLVAIGHGLDGALIDGGGDLVAWLLAGGLLFIAAGLTPQRVGALQAPALAIPFGPVPAAALGAAAGVFGGVRASFAGRWGLLCGLGLIAWGLARGLALFLPAAGAWATVAGALALAGWLWQANAVRLLARLVTAFVLSLLGVVVVLAVVLSTLGGQGLVQDELRTLASSADDVAGTIGAQWPREAVNTAEILRSSPALLAGLVEEGNEAGLQRILERTFGPQDFLAILNPDGEILLQASKVDALGQDAFHRSLPAAEPVEQLLASERESGGLVTVGSHVVALGGIRVFGEEEARAEDPPLFVVVTGRIADTVWAAQAASRLPHDLILSVGESVSAASGEVGGAPADAVVAAYPAGEEQLELTVGDVSLLAAGAPVLDPFTGNEVAQVLAVRSGEVLAQVERDQARQLFLIALAGALVAGLVASLLATRVVAPIRRLTGAAAAVREGDLTVTADVGSPDEIGELGRAFDAMTTSLAEQSGKLRDAAEVQSRLRARLEAMTASLGDALVAVDTDGKIVTFNPAAERLIGRDAADVLGLPLGEVLTGRGLAGPAEADHGRTRSAADTLGRATSEEVVAAQALLETVDGRVVPIAATAAPVRDAQSQVLGRVLVLRDISREAELERMKSQFLSNVSHELRTPLTPIKGYAEVLARRDVGANASRRYAEQILEAARHMERVVGTIVDFATLDSGQARLFPTAVEASDVVAEAVQRWRARTPGRPLRRRVARGLPLLLADREMLQRALDELLDNAVKFSPAGAPISVTADLVTRDGRHWVRLSVHDRGVGMEPEAGAEVFADFYQADASETRHYGGLGLGLALVQRIVQALDGRAALDSEVGRGTTVHLLLPVAGAEDDDTLYNAPHDDSQ